MICLGDLDGKLEQHKLTTHQGISGHMVPSSKHLVCLQMGLKTVSEPVRGLFARTMEIEIYSTLVPEGNWRPPKC